MYCLKQWFSTRVNVDPPGDIWQYLEPFWLSHLGWGLFLASSSWKLGLLLNILQYIGRPPPTKIFPDHNVKHAKIENLSSMEICSKTSAARLGYQLCLLQSSDFILFLLSVYITLNWLHCLVLTNNSKISVAEYTKKLISCSCYIPTQIEMLIIQGPRLIKTPSQHMLPQPLQQREGKNKSNAGP